MIKPVVFFGLAFGLTATACRQPSSQEPAPSASALPAGRVKVPPTLAVPAVQLGDIVELVPDTVIAATLSGSVLEKARSGPGLVIGIRSGKLRVLVADGSSGWTSVPLRKLASANIRIPSGLVVERFPPSDSRRHEQSDHPWLSVPSAQIGSILGASLEKDAPVEQVLRLEAAAFLEQPLIHVSTSLGTGYIHALKVDLEWETVHKGSVAHPDALGIYGIVRRPFLAPIRASALAISPRAGETVFVLREGTSDLTAFRPMTAPAHKWAFVDTIVHDPSAQGDRIVSLAVVADGGSFAFVFVDGKGGRCSVILARGEYGSPWIARVEIQDLDGDGLPEWVFEVVKSESHSVWSRLFVVSGASLRSGFSGAVIELGGNLPEDGETSRYAWFVDAGHLYIAKDRERGIVYNHVRWTSGTALLDPRPPTVVITGSFPEAAAAKADAAVHADGRMAFPMVRGWAVGRFFEERLAAKAWGAKVGGRQL